jgi:2-polyprenyl-3-methyl-5-hydroxy-6-metoxy-1,4-benzoquinol methylase
MDQSTINFYRDNARQVAERYESVVSDLSKHFAEAFNTGQKVLDIGCGSGQ